MNTQQGVRIKCFRSDRGGSSFLKSQGTERRFTTRDPQHPSTQRSRRVAEPWTSRTSSLCAPFLPATEVTPHEQLYRSKPDLSGALEWGRPVWSIWTPAQCWMGAPWRRGGWDLTAIALTLIASTGRIRIAFGLNATSDSSPTPSPSASPFPSLPFPSLPTAPLPPQHLRHLHGRHAHR